LRHSPTVFPAKLVSPKLLAAEYGYDDDDCGQGGGRQIFVKNIERQEKEKKHEKAIKR
jgi:hypothetical protein